MFRTFVVVVALFMVSGIASAQTVVDESDRSCLYFGSIVGLNPQGDNFLSVRRRPNGPSGLAEEADRLFTNDRVCVASVSGNWLNVRYMRVGRMYSGWVFDRYVTLSRVEQPIPTQQSGLIEVNYVGFKMPSGNIICNFDDNNPVPGQKIFFECQMRNHNPSFPDTDCRGEPGMDSGSAGSIFYLTPDANLGRPGCLFDQFYFLQMFDRAPTLDYGQTWSRAGIMCRSDKNGLTCTNPANHGFFLSRAKQVVF